MGSVNSIGWLLLLALALSLVGGFYVSPVFFLASVISLLGLSAAMAYASARSPFMERRMSR